MSQSRSKRTVNEVMELAMPLNLNISRLAPSWGWFEKMADGSRKLFAKTNDLAFERLEELTALLATRDKKLKTWHSTAPAAILSDLDFDELGAFAPSKAALVRLLDSLYGCGPGTGKKSHRCRVNKYWQSTEAAGKGAAIVGEAVVWYVKDGVVKSINSPKGV